MEIKQILYDEMENEFLALFHVDGNEELFHE